MKATEVAGDGKGKQKERFWPLGLLVFALLIYALVHTIQTRSKEDILLYATYISVPLLLIIFLYLLFESIRSRSVIKSILHLAVFLMLIPATILLCGIFYYTLAVAVKDIYLWYSAQTLSKELQILVTIAFTLVSGVSLFFFRLKLRAVYGLTEGLVGLAIAGHRVATVGIEDMGSTSFYLALLTAGVYLVVRGIDNIHQGITKEPLDPVAAKFIGIIQKYLG